MKRLLACLAFLSASPAFSQGFDAAFLGGYTTPGGIETGALGIQGLELEGSFTWGASASYFFSPRMGVEVSWVRQDSALEIATNAGSAEMFDVNVDQLQGSLVFRLGGPESRVRPFLSAGAGAAFFSAPNLDSETKLSFGLGAGIEWLPSRRVGRASASPLHPDLPERRLVGLLRPLRLLPVVAAAVRAARGAGLPVLMREGGQEGRSAAVSDTGGETQLGGPQQAGGDHGQAQDSRR